MFNGSQQRGRYQTLIFIIGDIKRDSKHDICFYDDTCFVYYESINRDLKRRPIYEYRCDERLKNKSVLRSFFYVKFIYSRIKGENRGKKMSR